MNSGQWQGTEGYKRGNLKRQLESVPLFELDSTMSGSAIGSPITKRCWLSGLNGNLKVLIACGVQSSDYNSLPFPYVATPGTIQIYPVTKMGDSYKLFLRPVFQDPTVTDNSNAPLPQMLPYGWEVSFSEIDECMVEVVIDPGNWAGANLSGTVTLQVTVEYDGAWWDVEAFTYAMGQVQFKGVAEVSTIGTGGE